MEVANNIRSFLLSICLCLVLQNGSRMMLVRAQYTNALDVLGLLTLVQVYPHLDETVVDPCYPVAMTWIECSYDYTYYYYRVTALNLGSRKLNTGLPDFSSTLTALEIIDLHDNSLSGPIPTFFSTFVYLTKLDLSDNRFTGSIPSSLTNKKNLLTDFSGNPGLGSGNNPSPPGSSTSPPTTYTPTYNYSPSRKKKKSSPLPIVFGIIGAFALIAGVVGILAIHKQKQRTAAAMINAASTGNAAQINPTPANSTPVEKGPINNQNGATNA